MKRLILGTLLVFTASLQAQTIPLEDFIKHGDYLSMEMSPDGKHLLAIARTGERMALLFIDATNGELINGVQSGDDNTIESAAWVNNERAIWEFGEKQFVSDRATPKREVFARNIDGSGRFFLYGMRAGDFETGSRFVRKEDTKATFEILSTVPDDNDEILIIEYPWRLAGGIMVDDRFKKPTISRLDVYTGRKYKVEGLPEHRSFAVANKKGQVRLMGWRDDANKLHTAYRASDEAEWKILSSELGPNSDHAIPQAVNHDGTKGYLLGVSGEQQLYAMFELDLQTGEHKQIFAGDKSDIEHWIADIETEEPVVGISYPEKHVYHYSDQASQTAALHKKLAPAFGGQEVRITDSNDNGTRHLVHVSSDVNPGEYYVFNSETNDAQFIWANRSWIDPRLMRAKEPFEINSRDNVALSGYLTLPSENGNKPPLVVMIHSGPQLRALPQFEPEVQLLAHQGFAVLQVNFRGSSGYGQTFREKGNGQWGESLINDIIDATQWAIDEGKVSPDKICAFGEDFGGYAAVMLASKAPEMISCTIGLSGVYDLESITSDRDTAKEWGGQAYLAQVLGGDPAQLKANSPLNQADKVNGAVMVIHSDGDRRSPISDAKKMENALERAGKEVTSLYFPMGWYGIEETSHRLEIYQGVVEFLNEHIGS